MLARAAQPPQVRPYVLLGLIVLFVVGSMVFGPRPAMTHCSFRASTTSSRFGQWAGTEDPAVLAALARGLTGKTVVDHRITGDLDWMPEQLFRLIQGCPEDGTGRRL